MKVAIQQTACSLLAAHQNVVSVAIYGGLGNQLFQYSLGRAVAHNNSSILQLDLRHFDRKRAFRYGLDNFNISAVVGSEQSLPPCRQDRIRYLKWRYLSKKPRLVREKHLGFEEHILESKGDIYLQGYWQSYRYFASIADQIRQELTWANPPTGQNLKMLDRIQSRPSIAIHVRRGDYVSNPQANQFHGTCPPHYYTLGVQQILGQVQGTPTVFVFSDDPKWARENIRTDCECVIVNYNDGFAAHEDMRLMSACEHQVISNSTFSWWAAWLNSNPNKVVIAPAQWFADPMVRNDDLIPEDWIRLDYMKDRVVSNQRIAA